MPQWPVARESSRRRRPRVPEEGADLVAHRYSVGDNVELRRRPYDRSILVSLYTVVRLMPNDSPDREYRLRNSRDGHERVVVESELIAR